MPDGAASTGQAFSSDASRLTPMNKASHPGFSAVAAHIAHKEGIPKKNAGAILAASSRNASAAARKKNPALRRVK